MMFYHNEKNKTNLNILEVIEVAKVRCTNLCRSWYVGPSVDNHEPGAMAVEGLILG